MKKLKKLLVIPFALTCMGVLCVGVTACGTGNSNDSEPHTCNFQVKEQKDATCEEDGYILSKCSCGEEERTVLTASGHDEVFHEGQEPTCIAVGWKDYYTCDNEGCNYTTYEEIPMVAHDEVFHEGQEPTCIAVGWKDYYTCDNVGCNYTTYEEIPMVAHDEVFHQGQEPTCEEIGWYDYYTCNNKGCNYTTYQEIPALTHDEVFHEGQEASCGKVGWKDYYTCNNEGCDYTTYEEIPALTHDYIDGVCTNCKEQKPSEGLLFNLAGDGTYYEVAGLGECTDTALVIPSTHEGLPVKGIANWAFNTEEAKILKSVVIPSSVTSVGTYAFAGCIALESATIGSATESVDSVMTIGTYMFGWCESLTSVTIGNSVASIGAYAFFECPSLASVDIPDSVKSIGTCAFAFCDLLASVDISNSVTVIEDKTFDYCTSLTSIVIPDSVTSIGKEAFYHCPSLTSAVIGASVTSIGSNAFYECFRLTEVYNKSALEFIKGHYTNGYVSYYAEAVYTQAYESKLSVDENGFILYTDGNEVSLVGCTGELTQIQIPNNITNIRKYAFYQNKALTSVIIPDSVTEIESSAFSGCDALASVSIGKSVSTINVYAFSDCGALANIEIDENNTVYKSVDGNIYSKDGTILYFYAGGKASTSFVVPDTVTAICMNAFHEGAKLTSIVIPTSVKEIGMSAISGCDELQAVYYCGTESEWNEITVGFSNGDLDYATKYYYSENEPTESGDYWYYLDGVITHWTVAE